MKTKSLYLLVTVLVFDCSTQKEKIEKTELDYRVEALRDLTNVIVVFKDLKPKPSHSIITYSLLDSISNNKDSTNSELNKLARNPYRYGLMIQDFLTMFSLYDSSNMIKRLENIKEFKDHGMVDYLLSIEYQKIGRLDESFLSIEKAIQLNPYLEGYYEQKASVLFEQKKYDELLKTYDKIVGFTSEKWDYHYRKYLVLMITGNANKARVELSAAIDNLIEFKKSNESQYLDLDFKERTKGLGSYYAERAKVNFDEGKIVDGCDDLRNAELNEFEPGVELINRCK